MALFFRNWIRSGVNKVSDLYFVEGKLDMLHMYDIIFSHARPWVIPRNQPRSRDLF